MSLVPEDLDRYKPYQKHKINDQRSTTRWEDSTTTTKEETQEEEEVVAEATIIKEEEATDPLEEAIQAGPLPAPRRKA